MKGMRITGAVVATAFFVIGYLMSGRYQEYFGQTLFLSGAIITSGLLISSAILEVDSRQ